MDCLTRLNLKGGGERTHHIHAFQSYTGDLICHRAFKAYLLAHPAAEHEYAQVKARAARQCEHDNNHYISLKNGFIVEHERRAVQWYEKCVMAQNI